MPRKDKVKEFLIEAEDIIQNQYGHLLRRLNETPSCTEDDHTIRETLHLLYQSIHTLKGISSICGFNKITTLSHVVEDMLHRLQHDNLKISQEVIDALIEGMDIFMHLLKDLQEKKRENTDITHLLRKIENIMSPQREEDIDDIYPLGLSDYERLLASESLKNGSSIYKITVALCPDATDTHIKEIEDQLKRHGEVIALMPQNKGDTDHFLLDIIFASPVTLTESTLNDIISAKITEIKKLAPSLEEESPRIKTPVEPHGSCSMPSSVRVDIKHLDCILNHVGEIFLLHHMIGENLETLKEEDSSNNILLYETTKASKKLLKELSTLRDELIQIRLVPMTYLFDSISWAIRKLCKKLSKDIKLHIQGHDTRLDKSMIESLQDSLIHIVKNSVYHGIEDRDTRRAMNKPETGNIWLKASHRDNRIIIEIQDDGRGIDISRIRRIAHKRGFIDKKDNMDDKDILNLLFRPGFTTMESIDDISGRGIGLDVVARNIYGMDGIIDIDTVPGKGTKFTISLPVTILLTKAMIVVDAGQEYAIPFHAIIENSRLYQRFVISTEEKDILNLRGEPIPITRLRNIFSFVHKKKEKPHKEYVIIVGYGSKKAGLVVDKIIGQREILIKSSGKFLKILNGINGFTQLEFGHIVPIVDVGAILDMIC